MPEEIPISESSWDEGEGFEPEVQSLEGFQQEIAGLAKREAEETDPQQKSDHLRGIKVENLDSEDWQMWKMCKSWQVSETVSDEDGERLREYKKSAFRSGNDSKAIFSAFLSNKAQYIIMLDGLRKLE